jgi:1-acyl-sn-glycerol-3-phosphate acyltransferase
MTSPVDREVALDRSPALPSRLVRRLVLWLYRWKGWTLEGETPPGLKYVIVGAPHTSNWDFVFFLGATWQLGIRSRFMGKVSLFRWPLRRFMHDMGGVPVDRTASHNYVELVIAQFTEHADFRLVIAPEGTRGGSGKWRSGFYHIALGAGVPVVPAWVDHATMRGGLGAPISLSGNMTADLARIAAFYRSKMPDHPKLAGLYAMVADHHG